MKKKGESHLVFSESYILGWKFSNTCLTIYAEFLLTKNHPDFFPFDKKKEIGCFKIGRIVFLNYSKISGIEKFDKLPKWNALLNEYEDVYEINDLHINSTGVTIETDELEIEINSEYVEFSLNNEITCI